MNEKKNKTYVVKRDTTHKESLLDYSSALNSQQYEVVMAGEGPILVIAGAGSGKTHTIVYRLARLIDEGISPSSILLATFTNKAAKEMLLRASSLIKGDLRSVFGGTFHHIGNLILRQYSHLIGFDRNFSIMDREDSSDLIKDCILQAKVNPKERNFPKANVIESIISFSADTEMEIVNVICRDYPYLIENIDIIKKIKEFYKARKKELNIMDFSDLLSNTSLLLEENEKVLEVFQNRFKYVLVDEYQDTNKIQARIIDLLSGKWKNLTVVGDDAQSIYSFRGAFFENIVTFPERYPNTKVFKLEENYRSTNPILELANASIGNNKKQYPKNLRSIKQDGSLPVLALCQDVLQQSEFVAQKILELKDEGISLSDIAILYRAHYHSIELQMELTRRSIPFEIRSGLRFNESRHVKDIISFLRFVNCPTDELAWKRSLNLLPGIGNTTASRIWELIRNTNDPLKLETVQENLTIPKRAKGSWENYVDLISLLRTLCDISEDKNNNTGSPSEMISLVLSKFYRNYIEMTFENADSRIDDINQLSEFALNYNSVEDFLSELALMGTFGIETMAQENNFDEDESIVLSTVHQSKGLEWKAIFVLWLTDSRFPSARSLGTEGGEEEERRLFYVSVTRAKDHLFLCQPMLETNMYKQSGFSRLSRFVTELPNSLYEKWTLLDEGISSEGHENTQYGNDNWTSPADPDDPDGFVYEFFDDKN
ncbi:MAG: ATP-dependent helicase [Nitrospinota bacterium]|nr:ATP-dependent helicase [Nitrospinota bacterium]